MTAVAVTKASTPVRLRRVNVERVLSVSAGSTLRFLGISANAACAALGIAGVLIFLLRGTDFHAQRGGQSGVGESVTDPDENMAGYCRAELAAHALEILACLQQASSASAAPLARPD